MAMRSKWEELIRRGGGAGGGILGGTKSPSTVHGDDWRDDLAESVEHAAGREYDSAADEEHENEHAKK